MNYILTADIGSTFTKVTAIDIQNRKILGVARSFTTAAENVQEGFENALKELYAQTGKLNFAEKVAASSAYGGLKMVSVGLVPNLTSKAAKMTASSAGAKVMKSFSYELSRDEILEIMAISPDIVLLTGGIDGGNKEVILANAKHIGEISTDFSVIVAGNKVVSTECGDIIKSYGKTCIVTENVMPEFEKLNIGPAKNAIRELFIKKIIDAKGLDKIQEMMDSEIVPTPLAVFDAVTLLSKGTKKEKGIGDLLVFDIGGATTDVYSCSEGMADKANVIYKGIKEPFSKRSVEADIGMRYSLSSLVEEAGVDEVCDKSGADCEQVKAWIDICLKNPDAVPGSGGVNQNIDKALAALAVEICVNRHAGTIEKVYTHFGEVFAQTGKDLSEISTVIGSGGVIINSPDPKFILSHAGYSLNTPEILKPKNAAPYLDKNYILTAMGLLSKKYPSEALEITKENMFKL